VKELLGHSTVLETMRYRVSQLPGLGASATTKFSRKDFGLTWNAALETGGILVGDEVTITLDVQFVKA
jgi:polyisoprenoid-binding protein YceI